VAARINSSLSWFVIFVLVTSLSLTSSAQPGDSPFSHDAITTCFADTQKKTTKIEGIDLDRNLFRPLLSAPRTSGGAFLLKPGAYGATVRSYCLHAGTHAPSSGDGYLYAPLKGPRAEIIQTVLRGSVLHPEFSRENIQVLIWTIESPVKLNQYSAPQLQIARSLLSAKQLVKLQGGVLGLIPHAIIDKGISELGPEAQAAKNTAERMQSLLTSGTATFEEIERAAVLPPAKPSASVPRGRWSLHPGGFYIRYLPNSYTQTRIEILVPNKQERTQAKAISPLTLVSFPASFAPAQDAGDTVEYDPTSDVAVPADTNQQRLGMSALPPPVNIGEADFPWKEITAEGDRGGHRCAETYAIFTNLSIDYTSKCSVEVCVPFSNFQGKVPVSVANEETAVCGTLAAQQTQMLLNSDLENGDICRTWMERFRSCLGGAVPGSTVSPVGTTKH
jgi:hypothetical protein